MRNFRRQNPRRVRRQAKERDFSPESELLLRRRLVRYKKRTGMASNDAVASKLSAWDGIVRWYPRAFSEKAPPVFNRKMLDRWIAGDTSHGKRTYPRPAGARLTVIAEFLIEEKYLSEFEIESDEIGFGLVTALQTYLSPRSDWSPPPVEGLYEGFTNDEKSHKLHRVIAYRERNDEILLVEYQIRESYWRKTDTLSDIRRRLSNQSEWVFEYNQRGWSIVNPQNQCTALLKSVRVDDCTPKQYIWSFSQINGSNYLEQLNGSSTNRFLDILGNSDGHDIPIMKSLTPPEDISYSLGREGGNDLAIIRDILENNQINDTARINREFLLAAFRLDQNGMAETLESGADVNAIDPETGLTALLYAATGGVRPMVEFLATYQELDPTIKDQRGRLPSDLVPLTEEMQPLAVRLLTLEEDYFRDRTPQP